MTKKTDYEVGEWVRLVKSEYYADNLTVGSVHQVVEHVRGMGIRVMGEYNIRVMGEYYDNQAPEPRFFTYYEVEPYEAPAAGSLSDAVKVEVPVEALVRELQGVLDKWSQKA